MTQADIDRAADLAREYGLVGLSSEGHRKLARLLANYRVKTPPGKVKPEPKEPAPSTFSRERAKPPLILDVIVKGEDWRVG